ncbi:MAG: septation protein A [Gammaproteobacteria bacterium]|jgi:intracellular septation protein|nr:septation protein A [Gammaproteobacteria bacterium]
MQALVDFLPALAFVVTYWLTKDMSLAIVVIMGAITLQLLGTWLIKRTVSKMLLASAALVIVLGGISLVLDDPVFFKWKPTGLYWLFAVIFLGSQYIGDKPVAQRMMTSISTDELRLPESIWRQLNLMWVAFFLFAGALNIYVAYQFDEATWVNFKLFGLFGLTFVFLLLQSLWLSRFLEDGDS